MAVLHRSDALRLELPFMDRACEAFIRLLARVDDADDTRLLAAWRDLVDFAAESFAREDVWMRTTGFSSRREHEAQHRVVLEVMREGSLQAARGQLWRVREMARQLRDWYGKHVRGMDAALALHLRGARPAPAPAGMHTATSRSARWSREMAQESAPAR